MNKLLFLLLLCLSLNAMGQSDSTYYLPTLDKPHDFYFSLQGASAHHLLIDCGAGMYLTRADGSTYLVPLGRTFFKGCEYTICIEHGKTIPDEWKYGDEVFIGTGTFNEVTSEEK